MTTRRIRGARKGAGWISGVRLEPEPVPAVRWNRIPTVLTRSAPEFARQSQPAKFRFPDHEMERPKQRLSAFFDHLPVAVVRTGKLAPHSIERRRQHPVLEWRAVAQSARLARQNRHVMPGIVDRLAAPITAWMFRHHAPVLADDYAIGVGMDFDRAADRAGAHRVFVVVEPHQAGLGHRGRRLMESVEAAAIGNELGTLFLEDLPDRPVRPFRMGMRLGPGDAFVREPGVQLVIALDAQARREEALAHEADLVLDLALLPARRRRAGDRLDEMVRAHLDEAAIVLPILADEDRLHRRLHVVVDAARAGALEKREGAVMR